MKVPGEKSNEKTGFTPLETMATRIPHRGNGGVLTGFTIVELLTVMSIIILLISLLVPALTRVRRYAQFVKQKAQFDSIGKALELFNAEQQGYPPSDQYDGSGALPPNQIPYCGAMKLAEAMVGKDLSGFNPNSRFRRDGTADGTTQLYPPNPGVGSPTYPAYVENIKSRRMHLQLENANANRLKDIYTSTHLTGSKYPLPHDPNYIVLCDVYVRTMATGNKMGMPILYYRADPLKTEHLCGDPDQAKDLDRDIYDRRDNQDLVNIAPPWLAGTTPYVHAMASAGPTQTGGSANPCLFYEETLNEKITMSATGRRPYRADSFILMSAGFDGEYGTKDDIFNFGE